MLTVATTADPEFDPFVTVAVAVVVAVAVPPLPLPEDPGAAVPEVAELDAPVLDAPAPDVTELDTPD